MDKLEKYCVNDKATIKDAISVIQGSFSRCAIVLNDNKKVTGVFSEGDVLRSILEDVDLFTPIKRVMKPSFKYMRDVNMAEACELFKKYGITLIPVIDNEFNLVNVITVFDIMDRMEIVNGR